MKQEVLWPGWETIKLIGRGSFGAVYEIQRDVLGEIETAALKVMSIPQNDGDIDEMYGDGYDDESITTDFQNRLKSVVAEYSLMRKMAYCPNVVNCEDLIYTQHEDGIGWDILIKMELLTPLIKALPMQIREDAAIKLSKDMCNALMACKDHDIVHRDIKPQNIFLSKSGDYKLGDFGIAKTMERTMGGTKIGTYKFMAPEVYHNQPYSSTADIYSLGLVLYWMLNERRMPFLPLPPEKINTTMEEKARQRRLAGEQLPPPVHGSERLKKIVLKACAYSPKDRYATAADMLRDLKGDSSRGLVATGAKIICEEPKATMALRRVCKVCGAELLPGRTFCVKCENEKVKQTAQEPSVQTKRLSKEDLSWRESEAAHRKWLKEQEANRKKLVEERTPINEELRRAEEAHLHWAKQQERASTEKETAVPITQMKQKQTTVSISEEEELRRAQEAHQYWMQQEKERKAKEKMVSVTQTQQKQTPREISAEEELRRAEEAHRHWIQQQEIERMEREKMKSATTAVCPICDAKLLPNRQFCVKCGTRVTMLKNGGMRTQSRAEQEVENRFQMLQLRRQKLKEEQVATQKKNGF